MGRFVGRKAMLAAFLVLTLVATRPDAESYGTTLQVTLPLAGLGCAAASGSLPSYLLRYGGLWVSVKASKRGLGDAEINRRPSGGYRGFPSGHTASAVFGASSLVHACLEHAPLLKTAIVLGAGFSGASRIEAGRHTIWQVLAGAILALAFERGLRRIRFRCRNRQREPLSVSESSN